ncbi:hypothetical protein V3H40_25075 [Vibrio parahaemolyticus]|uniref:hypothetical protein n=1 Tax=Vibrio parahaemolyticus TaxID=670 RepID=UPI00387AE6CC|nr:hypothetical protein [Vibrio parahaemolyticus]
MTNYVDESLAKGIVRRGLLNWRGTSSQLKRLVSEMFLNRKGITSVQKREDIIKKYLKKNRIEIYHKAVKVGLDYNLAMLGVSQKNHEDPQTKLTRSQKQIQLLAKKRMGKYSKRVNDSYLHAFVVKNDDVTHPNNNELAIFIFSTRGSTRSELLSMHSVTSVSRHCLERLVQRNNLKNIGEAIEEILSSLKWLEGSGSELAGREPNLYGEEVIKRHIPTSEGALLLVTTSIPNPNDKPTQECNLVTWIHKDQFKKGQEVTKSDFVFAQMVNHYISDPNLDARLDELRKNYEELLLDEDTNDVLVVIHGYRFNAEQFILSLESRKYLDFLIDFDKG